ncbi:hypothetical protein PRIPAC_82259 [Pristionchus pacificus]|uniref:G protein-coupled receptor n=1 Tax=Pristionchus pacificus TaxID=54126 RepID=A0A2A6CQ89_PRIPA|nr:hypothetical protein PRIPAC_82259 [Pristionchus pacificus]|eukprot:PDM80213.1 G protein-coupled receptor [Pristionchus pacificus]
MQTIWDPLILHPVPCGVRYSPLFSFPGNYDNVLGLLAQLDNSFIFFMFALSPSGIHFFMPHDWLSLSRDCGMAVLLPDSRWSFRPRTQAIMIGLFSLAAVVMPFLAHEGLEPQGTIQRYFELLPDSFPFSLLTRADCYDMAALRPFVLVGGAIACLIIVSTTLLIHSTLVSLHIASSLSEKARTHHRAMTRVLIMQALVPVVCIGVPFIFPNLLLCFSTHSLLESLVLIFTTPLYRQRLMNIEEVDDCVVGGTEAKAGEELNTWDLITNVINDKEGNDDDEEEDETILVNRQDDEEIMMCMKLYSLSMDCIAPAYFACSMYRHQAVQMPSSRWSIRGSFQAVLIGTFSIWPVMMPIGLEPPGSIERYREHLSEAFSPEILERVDCHNNELLRPFVRVGTIGLTMNLITTIVVPGYSYAILAPKSLIAQRENASTSQNDDTCPHSSGASKTPESVTLVPFCSIVLPLGVCFALMRAHVDGSLIIPHCILAFSTHSFCESLLLILTTPLYRLRLKKWLRLKNVGDSWAAPSAVSINVRQATTAQL